MLADQQPKSTIYNHRVEILSSKAEERRAEKLAVGTVHISALRTEDHGLFEFALLQLVGHHIHVGLDLPRDY